MKLNVVTNDIEYAAALDTRRCFFIEEVNRYMHVHHRLGRYAQEVDVYWLVTDRIKLEVLWKDLDRLAIQKDVGNCRLETAAVNLVVQRLVVEGNRDWRLLVTIDDSWHFTVAANFPGGPLTNPFARLGLELVCFAHGISFRGSNLECFLRPVDGCSKNMKRSHAHPQPDEMTAPFRVASKGVYADGGSITER